MEKFVVIVFWFASFSLIFVSLYPLKRNLEGEKIPSKKKERTITVLSLLVGVSFIVLVLLVMLDGGYLNDLIDLYNPEYAIAPLISLLVFLYWWRSIIKIYRVNLNSSSPLVMVVILMFIVAVAIGLFLTDCLWRPLPTHYRYSS